MKNLLLLLLAMSMPLFAQNTTYTTKKDGCGGKALQYCTLPVTDGTGTPEQIIIDNSFYVGRLTIQQGTYPNQTNIGAVQGIHQWEEQIGAIHKHLQRTWLRRHTRLAGCS